MKQTSPERQGIRPAIVVLIALAMLGIGAGVGVLVYLAMTSGSGEPSRNIQDAASTLSLGEDATVSPVPATATPVPAEPTTAPTEEAATPGADATADSASTGSDTFTFARGLYRIDSTQSEVRFQLDEDLRGLRNTVIGTTKEVAGDIIVDFGNPAASELGVVTINSRTLRTNDNFRNQALRSQILRSAQDAYEFITFTPTTLSGLPTTAIAEPGDTYTFQVTGDLHIIEITQSVTFDVTVTVDSPEQLSGSAKTVVKRSDYNLNIPGVPGVANVTDEVILEIDFVAPLVESR